MIELPTHLDSIFSPSLATYCVWCRPQQQLQEYFSGAYGAYEGSDPQLQGRSIRTAVQKRQRSRPTMDETTDSGSKWNSILQHATYSGKPWESWCMFRLARHFVNFFWSGSGRFAEKTLSAALAVDSVFYPPFSQRHSPLCCSNDCHFAAIVAFAASRMTRDQNDPPPPHHIVFSPTGDPSIHGKPITVYPASPNNLSSL